MTLYKSTNPYLEVRGDYVLAKLALLTDPDDDTTYEPLIEAEVLGHRDASYYLETGKDTDTPAFFADVPDLLKSWIHGWNVAMQAREMDECSGCNNSRGDPCCIHG